MFQFDITMRESNDVTNLLQQLQQNYVHVNDVCLQLPAIGKIYPAYFHKNVVTL